ncbi:hypothetical protein NFI96_003662 [Prochilodus magdalenae]|nr:hypothetical protein NFI96_003662 [Prochilodus magdalenae]
MVAMPISHIRSPMNLRTVILEYRDGNFGFLGKTMSQRQSLVVQQLSFEMAHGPLPPLVPLPPPFPPENPPLPGGSSSEESEYESGDDEDKERMIRLMGLVNQPCKRPMRSKAASKRKKPKLKDLLFAPKPDSHRERPHHGDEFGMLMWWVTVVTFENVPSHLHLGERNFLTTM